MSDPISRIEYSDKYQDDKFEFRYDTLLVLFTTAGGTVGETSVSGPARHGWRSGRPWQLR